MPTLLSYSANFEDVILNRIFGAQATGFFIDVGAAHPVMENDTKALYDRGWTGINIEPNPTFFAALELGRPRDRNLNIALSDTTGEFDYFDVVGTGLSTLVPEAADRCAANGHEVIRRRVRTTTLADVLQISPPEVIDLLKIDVEGFEQNVLAGNDWTRFRPRVIVAEATYPESRRRRETGIEAMLDQQGYRRAYFDGLNDFYVERTFDGANEAFLLPPNIFDNFISYRVQDLRQHAGALETELANTIRRCAELQARLDAASPEERRVAGMHAQLADLTARQQHAEERATGLEAQCRGLGRGRAHLQLDIDRLRGSVAALTTQARQYATDLEAAHSAAEELRSMRVELQRLHRYAHDTTVRWNAEYARAEGLLHSTSWRATEPLRLTARLLRAIRRRLRR